MRFQSIRTFSVVNSVVYCSDSGKVPFFRGQNWSWMSWGLNFLFPGSRVSSYTAEWCGSLAHSVDARTNCTHLSQLATPTTLSNIVRVGWDEMEPLPDSNLTVPITSHFNTRCMHQCALKWLTFNNPWILSSRSSKMRNFHICLHSCTNNSHLFWWGLWESHTWRDWTLCF